MSKGKSKISRLGVFAALGLVAALGAAPAIGNAQGNEKVRVIVAFKAGAAAAARAAITNAGGRVVLDMSEADGVAIEISPKAVAALKRNPNIKLVEEDSVQRALGLADPSGPPYQLGQLVPYGIKMVQADQLPDALTSDRTICIIDSGYDLSHEDLSANQVNGENLTTSGEWFTDELHHGTHVSGTVSAINNPNIGVVGVAPNKHINIYMVKVFDASGSAPSSVITKAMLRCGVNHANVISMSLGGSSKGLFQGTVTDLLAARNILLVAAAGNAGNNTVSYPAGFANVVSVAAIDINKAKASFSQFNPDVELAAPGVSVLSTVPTGTGLDASLNVGAATYAVNPMTGSPVISATAPLANFGIGDVINPVVAGKVCLIARGTIDFATKVTNCQNSGGLGAVIYNNVPGNFFGTLGTAVTTIPSVSASDTDGAAMLGQLGQSATVALAVSNYAYFDGTSMATPHVAGVAALVWSYSPGCSAGQLRTSLDRSAQDLGSPGRDVNFGFGLVQAKAAHDRIKVLGCGL